jgi:diacylglycerol kinase family enzyme
VCEGAALDNGSLSVAVLKRARHRDVPSLALRVLSEEHHLHEHPQVVAFNSVPGLRITAKDGSPPFPVQVDGDYIGDFEEATFRLSEGALRVVS